MSVWEQLRAALGRGEGAALTAEQVREALGDWEQATDFGDDEEDDGPETFCQIGVITAVMSYAGRCRVSLNARQMNALIAAVDSWLREVDRPDTPSRPGMTLDEWFACDDTGISSRYMAVVLGRKAGLTSRLATDDERSIFGNHPHDPADFGRCVRLLDAVPALRDHLSELLHPKHHPAWAGLVAEWPALESLYREEYPTGKAPKLYDRMKAIIAAATPPAGSRPGE